METLATKSCVPCQGGIPPLEHRRIMELHKHTPEWQIIADRKIRRSFEFPNFAAGLAFVNKVGEVAEAEGHHPDLSLSYTEVGVTIWTHKIDGLTESDFILAAKVDRLAHAD